MKRPKSETLLSLYSSSSSSSSSSSISAATAIGGGGNGKKFKLSYFLLFLAAFYLFFISLNFPHFLQIATTLSNSTTTTSHDNGDDDANHQSTQSTTNNPNNNNNVEDLHHILEQQQQQQSNAPLRGDPDSSYSSSSSSSSIKTLQYPRYGRITGQIMRTMEETNYDNINNSQLSSLEKMANEAWALGIKAWKELQDNQPRDEDQIVTPNNKYHQGDDAAVITTVIQSQSKLYQQQECPSSVQLNGQELDNAQGEVLLFLPCGLAAGSSITVIGIPHHAHQEYVPASQRSRMRYGDTTVMVSQFMVELQGLKAVDGEDPPRILHLNPRLRGDWSKRPVIEHNTCYRMQWGTGQRCDGMPSKTDEDLLVDGFPRCEKWTRTDVVGSKESKTTSWFKRFIGREQKPEVTWPFAFAEGRLFVLTVRAGVEGYHISVGGRHVTSFPYRTGFTLEDATGLAIKGDVDVHSVYATSLPISHPSFSLQRVLEMSEMWKASPLSSNPIRLFIGVLSATNHFAERMAVRKTWMQSAVFRSSNVVARFFVALSPRREVNAVLKKEAAYFGDIVILPFMDRYELVVLKTIAICEYGVHNLTASYIMKCDDDTFVRVDTVLKQISVIPPKKSLYMGNLNLLHRPLRNGKWAVTYEEWPEEVYPPYANGPGYIISIDIAKFIISQHANQSLRLFKMEDVSMGMWVQQFNSSKIVQYSHNWKFCQYGCMEDYYTAHYQSPRQMLCLWDKLGRGRAHCCNFK